MNNLLNKERLKIVSDDIKWISKSIKLLDTDNEDDAILFNKYKKMIEEHSTFLKEQLKLMGVTE